MAGETTGQAFEALTFLALTELGYKAEETVHWEPKVPELSVRPDFLVGKLSQPKALLLLTNTGSASNSHMKFWRNVGEMVEAKRVYGPQIRLINVVLRDQQMDGFRKATKILVDSDIRLESSAAGKRLLALLTGMSSKLPSGRREKLEWIWKAVNSSASKRAAFKDFQKILKQSLVQTNTQLRPLWDLASAHKAVTKRAIKQTYVKRGLAKLMFLTKLGQSCEIVSIIRGRKRIPNKLAFACALGWANRRISGISINDSEILWACDKIEEATISVLLNKALHENERLWKAWSKDLIGNEAARAQSYVEANLNALRTPAGMLRHLRAASKDGRNWLFFHVLELLKAHSGKKQGYGFAALADDVGYDTGINRGYKVLADWANGVEGTVLPKRMLEDVAGALSHRISRIDDNRLKSLRVGLESETGRNIFEAKVVCYEKFEPLLWLLERFLTESQVGYKLVRKHPSFVGEVLGTPLLKTTPVISVSETLIHWKSAYDQGRSHKVKELSGRAPSLKYSWDHQQGFTKRSNVKKLILLLDGTWRGPDLEVLQRAGWDEIFYPDEMDKLAKAIV
jgi:hypothetical protein